MTRFLEVTQRLSVWLNGLPDVPDVKLVIVVETEERRKFLTRYIERDLAPLYKIIGEPMPSDFNNLTLHEIPVEIRVDDVGLRK